MQVSQARLYFALALLTIGHFLIDFMIGILPVYKTLINLDIAKAGLIAGLCAFFGEGIQVIFGPLGDRGYRKILVIMGLVASASSVFFSYTQDYYYIFILYLLTCIGSGAFHPSAASIVSTLTQSQKSFFIGIFAAGGAFGLATSQLIFTSVYESSNRNTFFLAVPTLCLVTLVAFTLITPQIVKASNTSLIQFSNFALFFKKPPLRNLYIAGICNQSIAWGVIFLLPELLREKGYNSWISLGGGHLCFILGSGCMMILGGFLADKLSPRRVLLTALTMGSLSLYTCLFIPQISNPALCGLVFVMGASIGVVNPISIAFGNRLMPSNPGIVNACLMGLVWFLAEGIGQTGGSLLTTVFETDVTANALKVLGFLAFPAVLAVYALPRTEEEIAAIKYA